MLNSRVYTFHFFPWEPRTSLTFTCIKSEFPAQAGMGGVGLGVGGKGESYMKQMGMIVVLLRGVNFGFWSRLGCSGQSTNILSR